MRRSLASFLRKKTVAFLIWLRLQIKKLLKKSSGNSSLLPPPWRMYIVWFGIRFHYRKNHLTRKRVKPKLHLIYRVSKETDFAKTLIILIINASWTCLGKCESTFLPDLIYSRHSVARGTDYYMICSIIGLCVAQLAVKIPPTEVTTSFQWAGKWHRVPRSAVSATFPFTTVWSSNLQDCQS